MKLSDLHYLPNSPSDKKGWPWYFECPIPLEQKPSGHYWPKICIVTPSFNQAQYLEETIRSVLLQGYPNLEYMVIDGGSTDGSVEIIKKYAPWLTYWVSEPDRGQSHAINKGFSRSTGEIMAWINSDDYYDKGAFYEIVQAFDQNPNSIWIAGKCSFILDNNEITDGWAKPRNDIVNWFTGPLVMQPGVFWKSWIWKQVKGVDEEMNYSFDYDLWMKYVEYQPFPTWIEKNLAFFRKHGESKSIKSKSKFMMENEIIYKRYMGKYLKTPHQRILLWKLRKDRSAFKSINRETITHLPLRSGLSNFLKAISIAPWIILKKSYYGRLLRYLRIRD